MGVDGVGGGVSGRGIWACLVLTMSTLVRKLDMSVRASCKRCLISNVESFDLTHVIFRARYKKKMSPLLKKYTGKSASKYSGRSNMLSMSQLRVPVRAHPQKVPGIPCPWTLRAPHPRVLHMVTTLLVKLSCFPETPSVESVFL